MNNYEIDNMIEQIEEYEAQNRIETLKVNLGTSDGDVIFSKEISSLNPEGKVEIQLDRWIKGYYNKIINQIEYEIGFPIRYILTESTVKQSYYSKVCSVKDLENDLLVNEIIDKSMKLLNKNELSSEDFLGMKGYGEIIHCTDENGKRDSKLTNIEVCKNRYKSYLQEPEKYILEKKYKELNKNDEETIIKELNIDISTPMGNSKKLIVKSFCNQYIEEKYFMYRGYSFPTIDALVIYDDSKVDSLEDIIQKLDIRPKYIDDLDDRCVLQFCPNERFHFKTWVDYLKLLIDFVEYLETINIDGVEFSFYEFWDDINECIEIHGDCKTLSDIKFTKELFSWQGECL